MALATAAIAGTVLLLTASAPARCSRRRYFATNPNVLYLQSTPMTEPMLFGLTTLQVYLVSRWVMNGDDRRSARSRGLGQRCWPA